MNGRRVPCESAVCDSTSSEFTYPVPPTISLTSSHSAVEHTDDLDMKKDLDDTFDSESIDMNKYPPTNSEKGSDSTWPDSLSTTFTPDFSMPPSYTTLGNNNVQNYGAAAPQVVTAVQVALGKLQSVSNQPITILGSTTLQSMSLRLDRDDPATQNWEMMAEHMNFTNDERAMFERERLRTKAVIEAWGRMGYHTIGELVDILYHGMDRLDVITIIPDLVLKDVKRHENASRRRVGSDVFFGGSHSPLPVPSRSESMPSSFPSPCSEQMPTSAFHEEMIYKEKPNAENQSNPVQVPLVQPSVPVQRYDAFVLCNMADKDFVVNQFIPIVEEKAKLKLCLSDRDVLPGNYKFEDQMNYMFERSNKLVVILSDEFFQSKEHEWQSNLAISRDPASRQQRIIPVKYKSMKQRNIFDYLGCCDLTRTMKEEWFWNKIINGIKPGTV